MRGRKLAYPEAYDFGDRIMNLNFYKNFKDRYDNLSKRASTLGSTGFYSRERPNPHDKIWTRAKRILGVINVEDIRYRDIEILLEEGKINIYDYNLPALNEANFFTYMQPLLKLFPIMLW
ncbi:hypothetical protein FXO38_32089 [Capsicum annuum]|nr:hypothetical protein FXO38_32089 [Capsicum annuum]